MSEFERQERMKSLQAIEDMLKRSEKVREKFAPGTSQHSLIANRIQALRVASTLISGKFSEADIASMYTTKELVDARAPLASLLGKSEKAREKLKPTSWQFAMLNDNLDALNRALHQLEHVLKTRIENH